MWCAAKADSSVLGSYLSIFHRGNFGLTNFLMVLLRSFDLGRLGPKVKTVYRHTDGGSDNVSIVTHIMHWLLVYLGVADEIIWFRFESGWAHSTPC